MQRRYTKFYFQKTTICEKRLSKQKHVSNTIVRRKHYYVSVYYIIQIIHCMFYSISVNLI
jgi:hypothetical protein